MQNLRIPPIQGSLGMILIPLQKKIYRTKSKLKAAQGKIGFLDANSCLIVSPSIQNIQYFCSPHTLSNIPHGSTPYILQVNIYAFVYYLY